VGKDKKYKRNKRKRGRGHCFINMKPKGGVKGTTTGRRNKGDEVLIPEE
jgi:hypothetical protein